MPTRPKRGRPKPFAVGRVRVNIVRERDAEPCYYWRAIDNHDGRRTLWAGWATRDQAEAATIAAIANPGREGPRVQTVTDLLQFWGGHLENERPDLSPESVKSYKLSVRRLKARAGTVLVERLHLALDALKAALLRGLSERTAAVDLDRLRAAWAWARPKGLVPDRALVVPSIDVPERVRRTPSQDEIGRVFARVNIPWRKLGLRLLRATGMRIGEVATARRDGLDVPRCELTIRGKTGERVVPIPKQLALDLAEHAMSHGRPELLGVTYHAARNGIDKGLRAACVEADVPVFSAHALRRAVVDRMARRGVEVAVAAKMLGHTPDVMWAHYRQVTAEDIHKAAAQAGLEDLDD